MRIFLKLLWRTVTGFLVIGLLGGLTVLAVYLYLAPQLPSTENLRSVQFQVPLRVYTQDGQLISEFGEKRRTPIAVEQLPDLLVKAFLAAEDDRFFEHPGVDYHGLLRAAFHLLMTGEKTQGGSTITMQVARNFFLSSEKTYLRKLNEILLALKIERELTKQEILGLYLNKIYFGNRAYGISAAAQTYYGTDVRQLSLGQMAMLAGLPKAPSANNPIVNPERALTRRNYVLGRLRELGYISDAQYRAAVSEPDTARLYSLPTEVNAPYVAEMVRAEMVRRYGEEAYTAGYRVVTTVDGRLQQTANAAVRAALLKYDQRHGYRGPEGHFDLAQHPGPEAWDRLLGGYAVIGELLPGLVVRVEGQSATVYRRGGATVELEWNGLSWAHPYINENKRGPAPKTAAEILKPGDIVRLQPLPEGEWRLAQLPAVEGAFVALDPRDGAIRALVGGFDFNRSKFNRVTQAYRQPGSSFKPFIYSAALEKGFTAASLINDAPVVVEDAALEGVWRPSNYSGRFYGPTRLREALVHSRNLVSIRLLQAIDVGYAADYARRFGFGSRSLPRNLSLALGSGAVTPLELASAYAVFANGGFRVAVHFIERIEDLSGRILYQAEPPTACPECEPASEPVGMPETVSAAAKPDNRPRNVAPRVISAQNAYLMTSMMRDVIQRGTGRAARRLGRQDLAGKTGTTNDQHDAWFCGYNRELVAAGWVGFDQLQSLGDGETGGYTALPMWIDFMRAAVADIPDRPPVQPPGLVTVRVDPETGLQAGAATPDAIFETFLVGSVPLQAVVSPAPEAKGKTPKERGPVVPEQLF